MSSFFFFSAVKVNREEFNEISKVTKIGHPITKNTCNTSVNFPLRYLLASLEVNVTQWSRLWLHTFNSVCLLCFSTRLIDYANAMIHSRFRASWVSVVTVRLWGEFTCVLPVSLTHYWSVRNISSLLWWNIYCGAWFAICHVYSQRNKRGLKQ